MWKLILEEVQHTKKVYDQYQHEFRLDKIPPAELERSLASLQLLLKQMAEGQMRQIGDLLPKLEAFREYYDYDIPTHGQITMTLKMWESSDKYDSIITTDPLFWFLHRICDHGLEVEGLKIPAR